MDDFVLMDILDNADPELIESVNIEKDYKKKFRNIFSLFARKNVLYIDNFDDERAIEEEARRKSEIKAFGREVSTTEEQNGLRIRVMKKRIFNTGIFKLATAIAGVCVGIVGIFVVIIKLKSGTRTI